MHVQYEKRFQILKYKKVYRPPCLCILRKLQHNNYKIK